MPEYYHPGEQSEMKSFDVKTGLLMDLGCWIMYEVIILSKLKQAHSTLSSIPPFIVAISALVEYRSSLT